MTPKRDSLDIKVKKAIPKVRYAWVLPRMQGMSDLLNIETLTAAIAAVKESVSLIKAAVSANNKKKLAAAANELEQRFLELRSASLTVQEQYLALNAKSAKITQKETELNAIVTDRSNYRLKKLPNGTTVYAYQPSVENRKELHYLCQPCFDDTKNGIRKAILIPVETEYCGWWLQCPVCNVIYHETPP